MDRRRLLTAGMATLAASALPAHAHSDDHQDIVGSWLGTVTATNPPLGQFNDLISFHEGGVVTESRRYFVPATPLGNLLETTGHGAWERGRGRAFEAFFPLPPAGCRHRSAARHRQRPPVAGARSEHGQARRYLRVPDQGQRRQRPGDRDGHLLGDADQRVSA